ncbi:methyl-accepting chemotaxis protein [Rivihabitans pingtungensis]|uniref:methyl-accepting chemotaxis protein n=1 Tax=Rivihabitans pingtungensis TaxID=1054498 RepID=UPI002355106E|nr:PAS domain-containing methyl-accepting chemotaxis protein [Rivihabitans pingtungensis]
MFNSKLKQEISDLQSQLHTLTAQESAVSRAMAMIRFDRDGKVISANPLFLQTMGYTLSDLQGKPHSQLCFPDYANSPDYRAFWDRLRRGEPFSDRVRRRTADGREIWLEATYCPVRDAQGQIESFSKYASDITASVEAEAHNQARLNAINRAMAVIEFTPDGTVLDANENFLNVLGYRLDEVKGRHHRLFCDNEFAQSPEYQALWRQLARGEYYSGQIKRQAKNGAVRWLEASYNPVFAPDGKTVIGVVKFATDITERVESQRQESESARFAYEVAQETEALSSTGADNIRNSSDEIAQMAGSIEEAGHSVQALGERSQQITSIVQTIKDIADQTNLLALNAAIEAARAGETGRGFAVVADEVRKLAERTAASTAEISKMVSDIQTQTQVAVQNMSEIREQATQSVNRTREAGQTMDQIMEGARSVVKAISQYAAGQRA